MIAQLKYIVVLALAIPIFTSAQKAPGYLGKRFSVGYDAYLFPSFYNPNSANAEPIDIEGDLRQSGMSINSQHKLMGQWSFSKRASLIASTGFVFTNFLPQSYAYSSYSGGDFLFTEYPSMTVNSFDAGIRLFTQHFAPLGKFVEFKLGFATVSTGDFNYSIDNSDNNGSVVDYTVEGGSMTWPTIGMGFGTNRVIKDILILSYGIDFNFFPGGFGRHIGLVGDASISEFRDFEEGNTPVNQDELVKMAGARYGLHSMLNLKIGIGILL